MGKYEVVLDVEDVGEFGFSEFPRETWYNHEGRIDRPNGPARTIRDLENPNMVLQEEWYNDGVLHREGAPAVVVYTQDGSVRREEWHDRGCRHRENGPAVYEVDHQTGWALVEEFYKYGALHRIDGPASVRRDFETGIVFMEEWEINGKLHRVGGPASVGRDNTDGSIEYEDYYLNGKKVDANLTQHFSHPAP